jgi:glycosyltransferase involved in cell wall biosynthesis
MSAHPLFGRFSFSIYGDGDLFETQLAPLAGFDNVRCERRFLTQEEISALHKENGVFLVPTRMDTQGVSRDEAMASGLVPVTNAVAAVPEFTSDKCACLLPGEDADGLARAMQEMGQNPALFLERSQNAAMRVRRQSAADIIIPAELDLMNGGRGNG